MRNLAAMLLALALVAAGCGDDDSDEDSTTTIGNPSTSTEAPEASLFHVGCLVATDVIRVNPDVAVGDLPENDPNNDDDPSYRLLEAAEIVGRIGLGSVTEMAVDEALGIHGYVELTGVDDLGELSVVLAETADLGARPVYGDAFEGHWGLEPGGDAYEGVNQPEPDVVDAFEPLVDPYVAAVATGPFVGIVDSAFPKFEGQVYDGLAVGLAAADGVDDDPSPGSHGAFVASIIRTLAPEAKVKGAKSGVVGLTFVSESGQVYVKDGNIGDDTMVFTKPNGTKVILTDEAAVDIAIRRLRMDADASGDSPGILNLSLGTYACEQGSGIAPPAIVEAALTSEMADWSVFAAAGNDIAPIGHSTPGTNAEGDTVDVVSEAFFPAAFASAQGVGSLDSAGMVTLWEADGTRNEQPVAGLANVLSFNQYALGADLYGIGDGGVGVWSGSSFATAVASGLAATNDERDASCPAGLWHRDSNGKAQACP